MSRVCPYIYCQHHDKSGEKNIVRHGFFNSKAGKRRRYRCTSCGKTFSSNTGTAYHGIQDSRAAFDQVVLLSVLDSVVLPSPAVADLRPTVYSAWA